MPATTTLIILASVILFLDIFILIKVTATYRSLWWPVPWQVNNVFFINHQIKIGGTIMSVTAKVDQKFGVTWPAPVDKYGNAAEVENVSFSSDDENIATIEADPATGPYSAVVRTHGTPGATAVKIKADPKVGDETGEITGQLAVEVTGGEATGFGEASNTPPVDDEDPD